MKRLNQSVTGLAAGALQYLLVTGSSYLAVKCDNSALILISSCCLIITIAVLNVLYKVPSFDALLLRTTFSVLSYLLVMLSCAYLGIIAKLEKVLAIEKNGQNLQGLACFFLAVSSIIASVVLIAIKCGVLWWKRRKRQSEG